MCLLWNWVQFWARCLDNEFHLKFLYTLPTNTLGICLLKSLQGYIIHCTNWFNSNRKRIISLQYAEMLIYSWEISFRSMIQVLGNLFPVYDPGSLLSVCFRSMIQVLGNLFPVYDPGSLLSICFRFMIVVVVENLFPIYDPGSLLSSCFRFMILVLVGESVSCLCSWFSFEYYLHLTYDRVPCWVIYFRFLIWSFPGCQLSVRDPIVPSYITTFQWMILMISESGLSNDYPDSLPLWFTGWLPLFLLSKSYFSLCGK